ncbi:TBC1 domain family member 5, partial [Geosmithia morbida]
ERWRAVKPYIDSHADLRRSVKSDGASNPCVAGLRSVCWKIFLLSKDQGDGWKTALHRGRDDYSRRRDEFLKYIKHPEALAELAVDPLADEPNSPWDTARHDGAVRAEIQQDVQRLPDEVNYHDGGIQTLILDVLFVYCKSYPDRGGYRQGMHEILAPIVHVLETDSIDATASGGAASVDEELVELVDASFLEHDAYIIFSSLMENAQSFYAVGDAAAKTQPGAMSSREQQTSSIVERSKFIHEVCLRKVDPELASHLINVEILPQIFLIRWVRLLFSREFPFEQVLVLWDTILAVDPSLELIDLICVAMLIRIRWQLLEADYSVCLQLLLKYPPPSGPLGPHEFVDDAEYLRNHLNTTGGATLIMKHTGKLPGAIKTPEPSRPLTPSLGSFSILRQRAMGARSPLSSPAAFMSQQGGVEALFQGAAKGAKGMLERGEKLGINQAVRDAMGEFRRNMQGLGEARSPHRLSGEVLDSDGGAAALAAMEKRNQQLAMMLDDTVTSLRAISAADFEDKETSLEQIEIAAAKLQFVKIYLEDSTLDVPAMQPGDEAAPDAAEASSNAEGKKEADGQGTADEAQASSPSLGDDALDTDANGNASQPAKETPAEVKPTAARTIPIKRAAQSRAAQVARGAVPETTDAAGGSISAAASKASAAAGSGGTAGVASPTEEAKTTARSTLAQSSFSWMLEPDEPVASAASSVGSKSGTVSSPPAATHKKRSSNGISRERNAFLFGDGPSESTGQDPLGRRDDLFSMEQLGKR